jgi:hypothetical protein
MISLKYGAVPFPVMPGTQSSRLIATHKAPAIAQIMVTVSTTVCATLMRAQGYTIPLKDIKSTRTKNVPLTIIAVETRASRILIS